MTYFQQEHPPGQQPDHKNHARQRQQRHANIRPQRAPQNLTARLRRQRRRQRQRAQSQRGKRARGQKRQQFPPLRADTGHGEQRAQQQG